MTEYYRNHISSLLPPFLSHQLASLHRFSPPLWPPTPSNLLCHRLPRHLDLVPHLYLVYLWLEDPHPRAQALLSLITTMSSGYDHVDDAASLRRPLLSDSGPDGSANPSNPHASSASPIARVTRTSSISSAKSSGTQASRRSRFHEILPDDDDPLPASPSGLTRSDRKEARITNMDHVSYPIPAGSTTSTFGSSTSMTNTSRGGQEQQPNRQHHGNIYGEAPPRSSFGDVYRPPPGSDSSAEPTPTSGTFPPTTSYTPLGVDFKMHDSGDQASGISRDSKAEYAARHSESKSTLSPKFAEFTSDGERLKTGDPRKSAEAYFTRSETFGMPTFFDHEPASNIDAMQVSYQRKHVRPGDTSLEGSG